MDPGLAIVSIAGMVTGILIVGSIVWGVVQHSRIQSQAKASDTALSGEVAALREQVEVLQQQLADAHDRLEFTERVLAQGRIPDQLPRGG